MIASVLPMCMGMSEMEIGLSSSGIFERKMNEEEELLARKFNQNKYSFDASLWKQLMFPLWKFFSLINFISTEL
jgi:hypothetical protein